MKNKYLVVDGIANYNIRREYCIVELYFNQLANNLNIISNVENKKWKKKKV